MPVSLIDPAIKRRVAPILFNSEVTQTSESKLNITNDVKNSGVPMTLQTTTTEIGTSDSHVTVPTVDRVPVPEGPLSYASHAVHTLQVTFPPPLPLPENIIQPPQQSGGEELPQQDQIVSSQELQRLESQPIDSSSLSVYHPTILPSHSYMSL